MNYKQCEFGIGNRRTIAWMPAHAAIAGNSVQLKDSSDPEEFWEILSVGEIELSEEAVRRQARNYREFQGSTKGGGIDE